MISYYREQEGQVEEIEIPREMRTLAWLTLLAAAVTLSVFVLDMKLKADLLRQGRDLLGEITTAAGRAVADGVMRDEQSGPPASAPAEPDHGPGELGLPGLDDDTPAHPATVGDADHGLGPEGLDLLRPARRPRGDDSGTAG